MFTGIVEEIGTVVSCRAESDLHRLTLQAKALLGDLRVGGSVAVNGCCLTATQVHGDTVSFDLAPETVGRTRFDQRLQTGVLVNLERPLRLDARLDGHFVQGHVDGLARVTAIRDTGASREITFALPPDLVRYCVEKGSLAIDGVSLTCAQILGSQARVALIPHTLGLTTLSGLARGDLVNVEMDMIGKYVEKLLSK
jgi:riboflavin synthase